MDAIKIDKDNTVKSKFDKIQLEKGNVATTYESYGCKILTLPYQLNAIPVSSDGNYTDEEGQQWVCDEIDFERGMYIQRVGTKVGIDGFQETNSANSDMSLRIVCNTNDIEKVKFTPIICNKLRWEKKSSYTEEGTYISTSEARHISERSLRRAREELQIIVQKTKEFPPKSLWVLPEKAGQPEEPQAVQETLPL